MTTARKKTVSRKKKPAAATRKKKVSKAKNTRAKKGASMASKKTNQKSDKRNSLIGVDPLAWLHEEPAELVAEPDNIEPATNTPVVVEGQQPEQEEQQSNNSGLIELDTALSIRETGELYEVFKDSLNGTEPIKVDCSSVEKVDASGLQLLVVLRQQCIKLGSDVEWISPSESLKNSARLLGLHSELSL